MKARAEIIFSVPKSIQILELRIEESIDQNTKTSKTIVLKDSDYLLSYRKHFILEDISMKPDETSESWQKELREEELYTGPPLIDAFPTRRRTCNLV